jgi:hypothetical protein
MPRGCQRATPTRAGRVSLQFISWRKMSLTDKADASQKRGWQLWIKEKKPMNILGRDVSKIM